MLLDLFHLGTCSAIGLVLVVFFPVAPLKEQHADENGRVGFYHELLLESWRYREMLFADDFGVNNMSFLKML